ncbi:MAG: TylF/MycF/NovP-related O-methyltransferase [Elusimicrobiota bacterium]
MIKKSPQKPTPLPHNPSLAIYDEFVREAAPDRFQKILARYELFKMVLDVPGDIVECGVFKGSGIQTWAKLHKLFKPNNEQKIVGFDFFEASRDMDFAHSDDKRVLDEHAASWSPRELILSKLAKHEIKNVELVPGNVVDTTKAYAKKNLGFRISLLYLDVDNYEGSLAILKNFYPLISPGGIVAFDEYAYRTYGESDAVDEYFRGQALRIRTLPWANTPTGYIVKERF